jgi:hypothetical protein
MPPLTVEEKEYGWSLKVEFTGTTMEHIEWFPDSRTVVYGTFTSVEFPSECIPCFICDIYGSRFRIPIAIEVATSMIIQYLYVQTEV